MAKKEEQASLLPELKKAIRERQLKRLYFFHGEEAFLRNHYLGQMKKILIDDLTESFNYHKLTKETFDTRAFADAVECLPMMAENTFVVVDDIDIFKLPEEDRTRLIDVFSDIPEYCTVVFVFESVEWKPDKRLKKLWDAISEFATIVEFAKQDQRELINWVGRHFAANKKQITPGLCSYLIDLTGGTMTALAGEISKICAYSEADTIVKSDIDAVTEPVLDAVVFQMTNLMGEGNYEAALIKLRQLLQMQEEHLSILGAIGAHFRRLSAAKILSESGKNHTDYAQMYHVKDYAAGRVMDEAKRFSASFCAKAAQLILETDYKLKNSVDDKDRLLEMLVLQLAREARND